MSAMVELTISLWHLLLVIIGRMPH